MDLSRSVVALLLVAFTGCNGVPLQWENVNNGGTMRSRWFAGSVFDSTSNSLYVFGGQSGNAGLNDTGILGDTWRYDLTSDAWTPLSNPSSPSPSPRFGFVGGIIDNFWVISHGCDHEKCFSDTWALNLGTMTWMILINSSSLANQLPEARFTTAGGVYPGRNELWLSMGETTTGKKLSDTWVLRFSVAMQGPNVIFNATWEVVTAGVGLSGLNQYNPFFPHARSLHAGAPVSSDTFTIYGGCASGGQVGGTCPLPDSWTIGLSDRKWAEFTRCPSPRTRHAMIPLGNGRALLLGGSQTWGPGVFPQPISPDQYNSSEVYYLNTNANTSLGQSKWKRVLVSGEAPVRLDGVSLAYDEAGGAVYLFGGRLLDKEEYHKTLWRLTGNVDDNDGLPCPSPQFSYVHLHGVFMYVAWGLLLPLGVLLGRYYKWAWPCWFIFHIICQSLGVLFTVAGFVVIFLVGSYSEPNFAHAIIGIILTGLLIQQYLSGIFHPCVEKEDGKTHKADKNAFRRCWEVYHAVSGFISVTVGIGQVTLGVFLVAAPVEVWGVWCGLGGLWILVFILHECGYLCYSVCTRDRDIE